MSSFGPIVLCRCSPPPVVLSCIVTSHLPIIPLTHHLIPLGLSFHLLCLPFVVCPLSSRCSVSQLPRCCIVVLFGMVVALSLSSRFAVVPIPTLRAVARSSGARCWVAGTFVASLSSPVIVVPSRHFCCPLPSCRCHCQ